MTYAKKPMNGKVLNGVKTPVRRKFSKVAQSPILAAGPRQPTRRPMPSRPPRRMHAG